jgi:hypothetical protein
MIPHAHKDPSGRMSTQDIIKNCNELKDSEHGWEQVYAMIHKSIESNQYRVLRNGNTLFWIKIIEPKVAQMFVFNADTNKNFFRNMKEFAHAMDKAGYKKVFGITHNMQIINLIKRLNYPVTVEDAGVDDKGRQLYKGTVNV